ncbi:hypothetical protein [Microcystis phage MinS1]|nr:hypothetical protein [Microcystis phage MinS1]
METNTSTTTAPDAPRHTAGVLAHGLRAVARHMLDHDLPAPVSITAKRGSRHVEVHVLDVAEQTWVESIAVDDRTVDEHIYRPGVLSQHSVTTGRVGLGVRIRITAVRFIPTEVPA